MKAVEGEGREERNVCEGTEKSEDRETTAK